MTATYATVQDLLRFLNIEGTIPSRQTTGSARPDETIGTGDGTTTKFYLDQAYVASDTYSFRYSGSEAVAGTALTETTHYTLDKDDGALTLTAAGVTAVGTDSIFGQYSYSLLSLTDTQLQEALDRAQDEIDDITNTHFATATDATPDYTQVTNEKHDGRGRYDRAYYALKYPLPSVSTSVSGTAVTAADTSIFVQNTDGFLSSGVVGVGEDKITYTAKSSSAFTGCTGVDSAHSTAIDVKPYIIELSTTASGSTPTWQILTETTEFDMDKNTGRVHVYKQDYFVDEWSYANPPRHVPNRFRATYYFGHDTIPADIQRCCLMIASRELMHMVVKNKHLAGVNDFNPEMIDMDDLWIKRTLQNYTSVQSAII